MIGSQESGTKDLQKTCLTTFSSPRVSISTDMQVGINQKSAWTDYPDLYKFISIDIQLSLDKTSSDRETMSVLDLFGDVGGVIEIFKMFFGFLAFQFSTLRLEALITNRLYHVSEE